MTPVPAIMRHRVAGGRVLITAKPESGYPDVYRMTIADARRFAWALLADVDPDEANAAAAEQGATLVSLVIGQPSRVPIAQIRLPPSGSKMGQILQGLREGPLTSAQIRPMIPAASDPAGLLCNLRTLGCVTRIDAGGQGRGSPGLWALTEAVARHFGCAWPDVAVPRAA